MHGPPLRRMVSRAGARFRAFDARADDDNLGGNDDADDSLSDFSDNNSDGQCGA